MAKIKNPLHSVAASGALAGAIIYQSGAHGATAKRWRAPAMRRSPAQDAIRLRYTAAATLWADMSAEGRAAYLPEARRRQITAWSAFLSERLKIIAPVGATDWDDGATDWDDGTTYWD